MRGKVFKKDWERIEIGITPANAGKSILFSVDTRKK